MTPVRVACLAAVLACLALSPAKAHARTVWLCQPGLRNDPCAPSLTTTRFTPAGAPLRVPHIRRARRPRIDCFYVYPTVSDQQAPEATLHIDPAERSIALYQAARYSRTCRVWAPMYRQITLAGLNAPQTVTPAMRARAYRDVSDAWRTYLSRYNDGRGVVLIGHSQGTFVLRQLIAQEIDRRPAVRRRMVSAILLGGNVSRSDFRHVATCRSRRQLHCVVAFSTFDGPVPANSLFGRDHVVCTNPAALSGGAGTLDPVYPTTPFAPGTIAAAISLLGERLPTAATPWIDAPGSYRARCSAAGGAHVLQVTALNGAPTLNPIPDAIWGLHLADANIALGNLTALVRAQAAAYARAAG
jgi:Protein of unknown function (DUF3089)